MKILHICRRFYPCAGGTENYIYEISKNLIQDGIECRILTLDYDFFNKKRKFKKYEILDGIEIFRIPAAGHYKKPIPLRLPFFLFKWADIIHIHDVRFLYETVLLFKKVFGYKIVFSTHGFLLHTDELKLIKKFIIPLYYMPSLKYAADSVICISRQDYEYFSKYGLRNLYFIENGVDYTKYKNIKRSPVQGELLYFGRIDKNKQLDLLLKALAEVTNIDWRLNIAGADGFKEYLNSLKSLAASLGISNRITWLGFVSEEKLLNYLSNTHLCFFPSSYEGFGFSLIEAMAAGCICVANSNSSYKSIITDGKDGFILDFSSTKTAGTIIKSLLNESPERFYNISVSALKKAEAYDWKNRLVQIINIYKQISAKSAL